MTLLAVRPEIPQPDIGAILDVLAHRRPIEFDCAASPVKTDPFEVDNRPALEEQLEERFPFNARMYQVHDKRRIAIGVTLIGGPPIKGEGDSMRNALQAFLDNAISYVEEWERSLRYGADHQKHWGWVYRLLLAGDDEHILATLLDEPVD